MLCGQRVGKDTLIDIDEMESDLPLRGSELWAKKTIVLCPFGSRLLMQ
jgi:hypothetical protein